MSAKQPPTFNPEGGDSYVHWKADIEIWRLLGDTKIKQGPAVYLSLQGDARNAVRHLKPADLASDEEDSGVDLIIRELDKVYLKDETARTFHAIKQVIEFRREAGCGFSKFFVEFQSRYRELAKFNIEVPDSLKAYFLIKAANLSDEHERLVRATSKMESEDMKDKLQKVFGEFTDKEEMQEGSLPVKEECLYTQRRFFKKGSYQGQGRGSSTYSQGRGNGYSSYGQGRGNGYSSYNQERGSGSSTHRGENSQSGAYHKVAKDNPKDSEGVVMRCHECDSRKHFARNCPHRYQEGKVTEEVKMVNVTLVTESRPCVSDGLGKAILDSACTKTVAGRAWMDDYLNLLEPEIRKTVLRNQKKSTSKFRFGDGRESISQRELQVPLFVCDQEVTVSVDVVENDIPLLLGLPTMNDIRMILDTGNHQVIVNGKIFPLDINSSGHYEIPVMPDNVVYLISEDTTRQEKEKVARKLHEQFAHPSKERLIRLLQQTQNYDASFYKIIEKVSDECSFCEKYKAVKPKPIVSFPKATTFNSVVSMDLKELVKGKEWILHLEDNATCYTAAALINNKRKETIVEKIFKIWLAYFGAPEKFHSDCGREFDNNVFKHMNESFNIETSTTPGESPFSNGKVERANKILYETMMKTMEEVGCSKETALAWAVCAKNCLLSNQGYSPNMLVFGQNINLPMVSNSQLPALDPSTSKAELVRKNLNVLHKARENFIKAEASERIKRAIRHQTRTYSEVHFSPGDKVYFRRRKENRWRGPGIVLGKESNFVLIRHGAAYYRCHPCQLLRKICSDQSHSPVETIPHQEGTKRKENKISNNQRLQNSDDSESDEEKTNTRPNGCQVESDDESTGDVQGHELIDAQDSHSELNITNQEEEQTPIQNDSELDTANEEEDEEQIQIPNMLKRLLPHNKLGMKESNVLMTETSEKDLKTIAKNEELEKLKLYDVYEWVENKGQQVITCKWLLTMKKDSSGNEKIKARLVARGFEEEVNEKKDSPTCSRESLRLIFAVAATMDWVICTLDISSAFLQGNAIDRIVFIEPPKECAQKGKVWKLKRCLYGLVDAPREWYQRVCTELTKLGGRKSKYDKCLFLWHKEGKLIGMIITHVDDFQFCGTENFTDQSYIK